MSRHRGCEEGLQRARGACRVSFWGLGDSDLVLEHLEAGRLRSPARELPESWCAGPVTGPRLRTFTASAGRTQVPPALPLGTPSAWPSRSTRLRADSLPRRGLNTLCPLTPPPPTWPAPRSRLSRLHPSPATVPGTLKAAPPAPQRRPLLPQERSGGPAGLRLHRPGRGPTARAHSGGLGPRRYSAGRSASAPQPTPRPAPFAGPQAPPLSCPKLQPSPGPQAPPRTPA